MTTIELVRPGTLGDEQRNAVWSLLVAVDSEFVPPLSSRDSTTTKRLRPSDPAAGGPRAYFERLVTQASLLATRDGSLLGMMSFIVRHREPLLAEWSPASYVSTVAIARRFRRDGVARALYESVLHIPADLSSPFVATRTWSGNLSHMALLADLEFLEVARVTDDRGVGVDSVFYARAVPDCDAPASTRLSPRPVG